MYLIVVGVVLAAMDDPTLAKYLLKAFAICTGQSNSLPFCKKDEARVFEVCCLIIELIVSHIDLILVRYFAKIWL